MKQQYYFDYASGTPVSSQIIDAMRAVDEIAWVNPSAEHALGRQSRQLYRESLDVLARALQVRPSEIVITSGATEANNLAVQSFAARGHVVVSAVEHASVMAPAKKYDRYAQVSVLPSGCIDLARLQSAIIDETTLVSVMLVNNEIGTIQPLKDVVEIVQNVRDDRLARGIKTPLYVHTDAAQAPNTLSCYPIKLGVDMMTISSGKMYGPKAIGALYISSKVRGVQPIVYGGDQQRGIRSGTEDVVTVHGFAKALAYATAHAKGEEKRLAPLQQRLVRGLENLDAEILINGSLKKRIVNNVNVSFVGHDAERLAMQLDARGFYVATGAACSAGSSEPSHVLSAIGRSEAEARASLRISFGKTTDQEAVDALLSAIDSYLH
jgi:cysteine desulfurase